MNHLTHFGLHEEPFRLTPDRNFYYPSTSHTAVREVVRFGLDEGEGFIVITGEVGTGKTMLLRLLMAELPAHFDTALILSPHLAPKELMVAIIQDLGLEPPAREASMDELLRRFNEHLYRLASEKKRLIIVIDEAQNLPDESLEQLRLLSNFESDTQKLLQIVLVGQPELHARVEQPHLRQLLQRVTIMEQLRPLPKDELSQYVHFRLSRAGRRNFRLGHSTLDLLWQYSQGVPRLINKALNRALLVAYAHQKKQIDRAALQESIDSLEESRAYKKRLPRWAMVAVATGVIVTIGSAVYFFLFPG
ncbi:MAG: ExeA family protein [Thermodesulfobacteriota bacterium]